MFAKLKAYLAGTQQEFKLIKWPTFAETRKLTLVVVALSVIIAVFLGIFDYVFQWGLNSIINPF